MLCHIPSTTPKGYKQIRTLFLTSSTRRTWFTRIWGKFLWCMSNRRWGRWHVAIVRSNYTMSDGEHKKAALPSVALCSACWTTCRVSLGWANYYHINNTQSFSPQVSQSVRNDLNLHPLSSNAQRAAARLDLHCTVHSKGKSAPLRNFLANSNALHIISIRAILIYNMTVLYLAFA